MSYAELLKDPRWQRMRLEVLKRDDFSCVQCDDRESTLHVHHTFYERGRKPWEYHPDSLLTLCESCHEAVTLNPDGAFGVIWDGHQTDDEMGALHAAVQQLREAGQDAEKVAIAIDACRAARSVTFNRVRQPYTPEWAK